MKNKTGNEITSSLRRREVNRDVVESMQSRADCEDELHSHANQLHALCVVQLTLATEGLQLSADINSAYNQILVHHSEKLLSIIERLHV